MEPDDAGTLITFRCATCAITIEVQPAPVTGLRHVAADFFATHMTCDTSIDLRGNPSRLLLG